MSTPQRHRRPLLEMAALKVGGLFAGYGGAELAVASVLDAEPAWFCEFEKAPSKILAHHWPHVPNYGDVTKVDWANVEPVDIITGGSPCQDLSHAGKRSLTDATVRHPQHWGQYADAITRWERVLGRPAPAPTETGPKGNPRLSPAFVEWMMGLPHGWVTDVPGVTRNDMLKMLGNGIVPQQLAAALRAFLEARLAVAA